MGELPAGFGFDADSLFEGDKWEKLVFDETKAILSFFKADKDPDPLPDAPEFDNLDQIVVDKEAGKNYLKKVEAVRRSLVPRDLQCYLLENIKTITEQRLAGGPFAPDYKHIKTVDTGGKPALLTTLLRRGLNGSEVEKLLDICPDVYGLLSPTIRLFRVDYDDKGNVKQVEVKEGRSSRKVDAEAELPIPNFLDKKDVASILLGNRGRQAGSGVKSFSWALDGTQPAEVDNNITATLEVYFQSADDFFNNMRQAGKVAPNGFPLPNFIDLIVNSPAIRRNKAGTDVKVPAKLLHREYDGANFRIKAVVGWAPPTEQMLAAVGYRSNANDLVTALENCTSTFYLQCVRHDLDFRQDGTVHLSVQYQAALAGILSAPSANIFAPSTASILESLGEVEEDLAREARMNLNRTEAQNEAKQRLLEERDRLANQDRLIKYKKLLAGLFSGPRPKVYQLPVDINDLLLPPWEQLSPEQKASRAKRKLKEIKDGDLLITTPQQLNVTLLDQTSRAIASGGSNNVAEEFSAAEQARYKQIQARQTEFKFVPFMFFGDLIDNVIEQIKINNNGTPLNFDMFLADTDLIDPLTALRIKNFSTIKNSSIDDVGFLQKLRETDPLSFRNEAGVRFSVNIGDIPISVDAFQVWFKNNVVKRDLDKFYLLYFIKKICADLITKAFESDCFGDNLNLNQRYDAHPLTLRDIPSTRIRAKELGRLARIGKETAASKVHNAVVILPTDSRPSGLQGDANADLEVGIYHHHIGAACGLVKKITFSREDQEYLREANLQKDGSLGPEQLRELYSVTIEMVGNTLYENGQYVYVSPTLMDADRESLDYLGLHGYYMITSVQSTVTPEGFTTTIQALHQGVDFKDNPELTPEFFDVPAEPPPPGAPTDAQRRRARAEANRREAERRTTEAAQAAGAAAATAAEDPTNKEARRAALDAAFQAELAGLESAGLTDEQKLEARQVTAARYAEQVKALEEEFAAAEEGSQ